MKTGFNKGDRIVCIKECIMSATNHRTTTVGRIYTICNTGYIIDDDGDQHWFPNSWEQYFRCYARKEKLIRLNEIANNEI